jgi:RHS repeat-associated protein
MNEMTQSVTSAGMTSYSYSGDGLRVSKKTGSVTTGFAWDTSTSVPELDQDGSSYYIYGPGGLPVERVGPTDNCYLMVDGAGSVVMSTDSTGTITSTRSFDAWGNVVAHTGDPVSLGWQGQYQDPETGFYYLRHRYYDPTTAQFTTPDPLFAMTRSRYGYAANDPVNWSDPLGLFGFGAIATVFSAVAGGLGPLMNELGEGIVDPILQHKKGIEIGLGIALGLGAVVTGAWALAAGATLAGGLLGFSSVGLGLGAAAFDYGPCVHESSGAACAGLSLGLGGAVAGLAGAAGALGVSSGVVAEGSGADMALTGIGAFGWVGGFIGTTIDYTYALESKLNGRSGSSGG